jgi:hypothetical protein
VLGKTNTIAVVVPDLGNPTFHGVLRPEPGRRGLTAITS